MELKDYQQGVLRRMDQYLLALAEHRQKTEKLQELAAAQGIDIDIGDYCEKTWKYLQGLGTDYLPALISGDGNRHLAPWLSRHDGLKQPVPNICLKVPTGGGKTLLAAATLERLQTDHFKRQTGMVLWVVPSDAIYKQTWRQLANREHPYRQMLERASGGRVKLLEKTDAFTAHDVNDFLCIMLLMLPSAARQSKDTLRMFRDSGRFTSFFPELDDACANEALLQAVPNLDVNDLADVLWDGPAPSSLCSIKHSLGNVLRLIRPVIVIDEGHKAYSDTARDTLCGFNPCFILELSATPNTNGKHQSNVLVNVPGADLKDEEMIKLPINVTNIDEKGDWGHTLAKAHERLNQLHDEAQLLQTESGRYIRPIMLVRVERTGKDQRDTGFVHAEDVREYLLGQLGARAEEIRLKTSETDELGDEDLLSATCPVRFIITKDALREGWDCPFAYVLTVLSRTTANTALTQMIGRVLRQPHARLTHHPLLDECYVYTFDQEVKTAIDAIKSGLQDEGMADLASSIKASSGSGAVNTPSIETVKRRQKFAEPPVIFLPKVLRRDGTGFRPFDYDRDILGLLDWESFSYRRADSFTPAADTRKETTVRVSLAQADKGPQQVALDLNEKPVDYLPETGLDKPFLVRQLLDVVPNPWQGMRILEATLAALVQRGIDDNTLYASRLELIQDIKRDLRAQVHTASEELFREQLSSGETSLHLASSDDPFLNWKLHETIELLTSEELRRKNGAALERSLFEKLSGRDFNELEKNTAWYLDENECVHWWHRIAVHQGSYSIQGWQRHKVYPDLLVCLQTDGPDYRLAVLETKGEHLKGNDDTEYKRRLFDLLTEYAGKATTIGELDLGRPVQMSFTMLMEDDWKQAIHAVLPS
ncbi:MAG: DEAD/DEAH box helicase family protein [Moraxellaceae bacterium]|jgi:type III restriction enzyme|nr:DEAD/DEAH box helicase family protein [Sterolibacterium sp.]MCC6200739.1 DEAD/DEAH box helicase family protein [Moraxellaceae bacterium]